MVRVVIVEDQKIMQKYFEYIILKNPEFKLVDTVSDAREAVKICNYSVIDLVLTFRPFIITMGWQQERL